MDFYNKEILFCGRVGVLISVIYILFCSCFCSYFCSILFQPLTLDQGSASMVGVEE